MQVARKNGTPTQLAVNS